jgi:Sulfotransferase family
MDTTPSTYHQSAPVKQFNVAARAGLRPGSDEYDLSVERLVENSRRETGLTHFGDEHFLQPMRALLTSIATEASPNPFGRSVARSRAIRALTTLLQAHAAFEMYPQVLQWEIRAPIIIVGPHRSGTTRLHHLLTADKRLQYLTAWEGLNPAPRFELPDLGIAQRREDACKILTAARQLYPGAQRAHPMDADWAEEEMLLLNHSFCGFPPLGEYYIPSYYRWFLEGDKSFGYRIMADLLRLISWARGPSGTRRWILKCPQHMLDLDALLTVFPDAKLVFTHRDPIKTVGSVLALMWNFAVQHTDLCCRAQIREIWLDFCEQMARRCIHARAAVPAAQQLDLHYEDINRDWRAAVRRFYKFTEMELSEQTELAMSLWVQHESAKLRSTYRYHLEDFGISAADVDSRMMFVRHRFNIPYEMSR